MLHTFDLSVACKTDVPLKGAAGMERGRERPRKKDRRPSTALLRFQGPNFGDINSNEQTHKDEREREREREREEREKKERRGPCV